MSASEATAGAPETEPAGATPDQPVAAGERLVALDFIRGIAVLGILFANITAFGHPMIAYAWPDALPGGGSAADTAVWLFQFTFVDGKFRGLFTVLFGAGLYLFVERAWARGASLWLQARRLFWLMLFGLAHFWLLWWGDILFAYALAGFVVLPMLGWTARGQLWGGLIWYVLASLAFTGALGTQAALESQPEARERAGEAWAQAESAWEERVAEAAEETRVMTQGGYADTVAYRFTEKSSLLLEGVALALLESVPLMLAGMALYRFGFFAGALDRARMRRWGWIGLAGGALASLALGLWAVARDFPPFLTQFLFSGLSNFPRLPMVLGLAALLVLWAPSAVRTRLGARVAAAGRMAFSNYIGTTVMMVLLFQGWAGGLYGELDRPALLLPVALGWTAMLVWSKPWLARYRFGPLEWLWRCLTYGKRLPLAR